MRGKVVLSIIIFILFIFSVKSIPVQAATPNINKLNPKSGIIDSIVTIKGSGFGISKETGHVKIDDMEVDTDRISIWTDELIEFRIPLETNPGNVHVVVTLPKDVKSNEKSFIVTAIPEITNVKAGAGAKNFEVGKTIEIIGKSFGKKQGTVVLKSRRKYFSTGCYDRCVY